MQGGKKPENEEMQNKVFFSILSVPSLRGQLIL